MPLLKYHMSSGTVRDYGPTRTLALYTGSGEISGSEAGAGLTHRLAQPDRNPWLPVRGSTTTLVWLPGDQVLTGTADTFRRLLYEAPAEYMVATRLPLGDGIDFVGLEPRLIHDSGSKQHIPKLCMQVESVLPKIVQKHLFDVRQPWSWIKLAMHEAGSTPLKAAERLGHVSAQSASNRFWAGLAARNQACALIVAADVEQAWNLLMEARNRFVGYKELDWLLAWLLIRVGELATAETVLANMESGRGDSQFFQETGEINARRDWLRARVFAQKGKGTQAFEYLLRALMREHFRSVYLEDMIELAPPAPLLRKVYASLVNICWRSPMQLPLVLRLLTQSGLTSLTEKLLEAMPIDDDQRDLFLSTCDAKLSPNRVVFEGEFLSHHSLSRVNRMLALGLQGQSVELDLVPTAFPSAAVDALPGAVALESAMQPVSARPDITIRHSWPHDFSALEHGKLVMYLPWEFGSLPKAWFRELSGVDEVWVYTNYVRDFMICDGVDPKKVKVVPCGVDTMTFRPDGSTFQIPGSRGFTFLFVGGTIPRKGVDLLVEAYWQEFRPDEDVTLVLKDFGSGSIYTDTMLRAIQLRSMDPSLPHTLIHTDTLTDQELAGLYRGCGALVHPYRGEGFGLPIAEAMACGAPVIVTGAGACLDFCHEGVAYLLPAIEVPLPRAVADQMEPTVRRPSWHEVSVADLRRTMRHVFTNREEARERGREAARWIASRFTWDHSAAVAADCIRRMQRGHD